MRDRSPQLRLDMANRPLVALVGRVGNSRARIPIFDYSFRHCAKCGRKIQAVRAVVFSSLPVKQKLRASIRSPIAQA